MDLVSKINVDIIIIIERVIPQIVCHIIETYLLKNNCSCLSCVYLPYSNLHDIYKEILLFWKHHHYFYFIIIYCYVRRRCQY